MLFTAGDLPDALWGRILEGEPSRVFVINKCTEFPETVLSPFTATIW